MTSGKYDKYITQPEPRQIVAEDDGRVVFNGMMAGKPQLGINMRIGLQTVSKPFLNNNPVHTHNFHEFLAWYGTNPDDPTDFQAEVVLHMGEEMEKYVFTRPTIVSIPEGLPHAPLEITRVDKPIVQLEIMLLDEGGTREPLKP
jgi:hypothetical protein